MRSPTSLLTLATLGTLVLACAAPQEGPADLGPSPGLRIASSLPASLAVLKPVNETARTGLDLASLRQATMSALMDLGYSPLSRSYVDSRTSGAAEASMVRMPDAGVIQLHVLRWDDDRAESHGELDYALRATLYGTDGQSLGVVEHADRLALRPSEMASRSPGYTAPFLTARALKALFAALPEPPPL